MFGKLMKYELRYMGRIFAPMWAIVLILSVLTRLTLNPDIDGMMVVEGSEAILPVIIVMLTIFAIITMSIVATVVVLQRFYKGMYGDEGYLMFTLPVTTGNLIHSKGLSALLMMVGSVLLTLLGVLIMVSYPEIWKEIGGSWPEIFQMLLQMNGLNEMQFAALFFWMIVLAILTMAEGIYEVYLAISIGQLWKKHPVVGAIAAYYVVSLVKTFAIGGFGNTNLENVMERFVEANMDYGASMAIVLVAATLYCILWMGISYFGTKLILDKKLNIA